MDVLSRIRELLSGKQSQKRKSSYSEELSLENIKKSRMSQSIDHYKGDSHIVNTGGSQFDTSPSFRNYPRRSDSFQFRNNAKTSFLGASFQPSQNDQLEPDTNFNHFSEDQWGKFKQPMAPPLTNGSRRIPPLISTMFNRKPNQPQQTVTPHYSRFGEPSELSQFRTIPDLHPIRNSQMSYSASGSLSNGHEQSLFSSTKFGSQRFKSNHSNSSTSIVANSISLLNDGNSLQTTPIYTGKNQTTQPGMTLGRYRDLLNMIPGISLVQKSKQKAVTNSSCRGHGVIDLSDENETRENKTISSTSSIPTIERVNTLKTKLETKEVFREGWAENLKETYSSKHLSRRDSLRQLKEENELCEQATRETEDRLKETFDKITISTIKYEEEEPPNDYPPLDQDKMQKVYYWVSGRDSGSQLICKFNLTITRHDIQTLQWQPLTWLNDEVINFYMELLAERSRLDESNTLPKVHGMNTFFLKRLMENGYSGVRRWTRKVDIFAHDIIPIPVHKGIHWCMAIIHMKNKTIKYYDSMGAPNNPVLSALVEYLKSESVDKKKVDFDLTGWTTENVRNIPQQENGSDCGVFSCMYAEFVTRNRPICFSQQHMQYFRQKMVYEICTGQMLN